MQFRWEKDWPTLFGLLTVINEGAAGLGPARPRRGARLPAGAAARGLRSPLRAVWLLVWLVANGPMRVPFVRWRFRGGRVL